MALPSYASRGQRIWHYTYLTICGLVFFYLVVPILTILPLSFSSGEYFTYTKGMLAFDADAYSLKHYVNMLGPDFFNGGGNAMRGFTIGLIASSVIAVFSLIFTQQSRVRLILPLIVMTILILLISTLVGKFWGLRGEWISPIKNSFKIAIPATLISVALGTLAAIGLSQAHVPFKKSIMAILISPMIVPLVVSGYGMFLFYAPFGTFLQEGLGLNPTFVQYFKVILAHAVLGIPFVIITVTATLSSFDRSLTRAAANMGAGPVRTFFKVQMPLILPGMISGGLFAFITSFDEVVVIIFIGSAKVQTLPWQMFTGLREQVSLSILAVATMLVTFSVLLLITLELLRRRAEKIRGIEQT